MMMSEARNRADGESATRSELERTGSRLSPLRVCFEREIGGEKPQELFHARCGAEIRQRDAVRRMPFQKMRMIALLDLDHASPAGMAQARRKYGGAPFRSGKVTGLS